MKKPPEEGAGSDSLFCCPQIIQIRFLKNFSRVRFFDFRRTVGIDDVSMASEMPCKPGIMRLSAVSRWLEMGGKFFRWIGDERLRGSGQRMEVRRIGCDTYCRCHPYPVVTLPGSQLSGKKDLANRLLWRWLEGLCGARL